MTIMQPYVGPTYSPGKMLQDKVERVQSPTQEVFEWEREGRRQKHTKACSHRIHMDGQSITAIKTQRLFYRHKLGTRILKFSG